METQLKDIQSLGGLTVKSSIATPAGDHTNCVLATLEGPFASYVVPTRNDRLYTRKLWERVINSEEVAEMFETRTFFGEADHPLAYQDRLETHLPQVSHCVTKLELKPDGVVWGELEILDTPNGRLAKTLIDYGSKLGISSRGAGSTTTDREGNVIVDEDTYTFVTFDLVVMPGNKVSRLNAKAEPEVPELAYESVDRTQSVKDEFVAQLNEAISNKDVSSLKTMSILLESVTDKDMVQLRDEVELVLTESNTITSDATSELLQAYSTISDLESRLTESTKLVSKYKAELKDKTDSLDQLKHTMLEASKNTDAYQSEIANLTESLRQSSKSIDSIKSHNKVKISRLGTELNEYRQKLDEATEYTALLESRVQGLNNEISQSESEFSELQAKFTESRKSNKVLSDKVVKLNESLASQANRYKSNISDILSCYLELKCESVGVNPELVALDLALNESTKVSDIDNAVSSKMRMSLNERLSRHVEGLSLTESKLTRCTQVEGTVSKSSEEDEEYLSGIADTVTLMRGC